MASRRLSSAISLFSWCPASVEFLLFKALVPHLRTYPAIYSTKPELFDVLYRFLLLSFVLWDPLTLWPLFLLQSISFVSRFFLLLKGYSHLYLEYNLYTQSVSNLYGSQYKFLSSEYALSKDAPRTILSPFSFSPKTTTPFTWYFIFLTSLLLFILW